MPGKKAKPPAKAAAKAAPTKNAIKAKAAPKAQPKLAKGSQVKAAAPAKPAKGAALPKGPQGKSAEKPGVLGSVKKMLGIGAAKTAAPAPAVRGGKQAAPVALPKGPQGKGKAAPVAQPALAKGLQGKAAALPKGPVGKGAAPAPQPQGKGKGKKGGLPTGPKVSEEFLRTARGGTHREDSVPHGAPVCREVACELMATTGGYCRMHYIKNWKKIQRKAIILREKKLNNYIEELVSKYPDKYIEAIRQDLASEKDFAKVIADLEIDESLDDFETVETENAEGIIDNLKRDFDDEGDVF